jgi:hypothetical protein
MISKKQNLLTKCFAKNKPVESTDYKAGLPDATSTEVSSQNTDEVSGSKAVCLFVFMVLKPLSKMSGSQSFRVSLVIYDSNNDIMYCYCIFAERQAQVLLARPNLLLEKNLCMKVLFIIIKG